MALGIGNTKIRWWTGYVHLQYGV